MFCLARWAAGFGGRGLSIRSARTSPHGPSSPDPALASRLLHNRPTAGQIDSNCRGIRVGPNPSTLIFLQKCISAYSSENSVGLFQRHSLHSTCTAAQLVEFMHALESIGVVIGGGREAYDNVFQARLVDTVPTWPDLGAKGSVHMSNVKVQPNVQ